MAKKMLHNFFIVGPNQQGRSQKVTLVTLSTMMEDDASIPRRSR